MLDNHTLMEAAQALRETGNNQLANALLQAITPRNISEQEWQQYADFSFSQWCTKGMMMVRREYLSDNDPESVPSLFQQKFGVSIYEILGSTWRDSFK